MKIRNGFVSNSSSSSFVILLPEKFLETVDYEKITDGDDDFPLDGFKKLLNKIVEEEGIWMEEVYRVSNKYDYYEFQEILDELFKPYIIASMDTGPDEGQIIVANREKIKQIL